MSQPKHEDELTTIDPTQLETVAAGAKGADAQTLAMLTSIGDSIKSLASSNQSSGSDPMLMMMMMGGMGGMGGGGAVAAPAAAPQVIDVQATIPGGGGGGCGRGRGKKGW